jgi:hypothetical protein
MPFTAMKQTTTRGLTQQAITLMSKVGGFKLGQL